MQDFDEIIASAREAHAAPECVRRTSLRQSRPYGRLESRRRHDVSVSGVFFRDPPDDVLSSRRGVGEPRLVTRYREPFVSREPKQ